MSTFGPVVLAIGEPYIGRYQRAGMPFTYTESLPMGKGRLWQGMESSDGFRPVVHVKPTRKIPGSVPQAEWPSNVHVAFYEPTYVNANGYPECWYCTGRRAIAVRHEPSQTSQLCEILTYENYTNMRWPRYYFGNITMTYDRRTKHVQFEGNYSNFCGSVQALALARELYALLESYGYVKEGKWFRDHGSRTDSFGIVAESYLDLWLSWPLAREGSTRKGQENDALLISRMTIEDMSSVGLGGCIFSEWENIPSLGQPGSYLPSLTNYWLDVARTRAFVDACENMPSLSDNSISNLQEILEFLLSVIRREPPKLPLRLNDAWLAYRYQYSTTKMDIKEAWEFVNRCYDLGSIFQDSRTHGVYRWTQGDIPCELRVTFSVAPRLNNRFTDFAALWRDLSVLGLAPDLYYLWDSTPFSFIIDWFLPVGDLLSAADASVLYTKENYLFGEMCYSLKYNNVVRGVKYHYYSRWVEHNAPIVHPFYWLENRGSASQRQVLYRAADAASLIIGGLT